MSVLNHITLENFKSIKKLDLDLKPLNVFIGANGAGKSNFVGVFNFLNELVEGNLQTYTGTSGGANSILYFGIKRSDSLSFDLSLDDNTKGYRCVLKPTVHDSFIIDEELFWIIDEGGHKEHSMFLGNNNTESAIQKTLTDTQYVPFKEICPLLKSWKIYHFHDTTNSAAIKQTSDIENNRILLPDGGNLAAFLYMLSKKYPVHFDNIQDAIRMVAPFFDRFVLEPSQLNEDKIRLEWKHKGTSDYFNASSLSDGTLRFMCLATLLLQPALPSIILLDEPELGLHPYAVAVLAGLLRSASKNSQVIIATQSVTLVNQFEPEDIVVVERDKEQSIFRRLDKSNITEWLEDYGLGDLWEKNILGGRP
ncbi:MAG: AAA family ATPase [Candidatus Latescibacter sp.]|nr:AAA family ATPase [Candidatus Latescibacter sp.]